MQRLDELNERQRRAVEASTGAVLIVAGPGTGKTKTLTARMAYLIEAQKVRPAEIVALTFTNKAAREMHERLKKLLGKGKNLPKVTTFHALGAELLRQDSSDEKLASEQQRAEIIREISKPAAFKGTTIRELSLLISRAKTSLGGSFDEPTRQLLQRYETALAEQDLHDFDDLLAKSFELLQKDEAKRPCYKYVLVDEFQDTSELQYELLKLLGAGKNFFSIGDPNQSIYSFRGAGAEMFTRFRHDFPEVQEIDLTINYRSRPEIIKLANAIFPSAPQLEAHHKTLGTVRAIQTLNEYSEAAYVLSEIEKGIGGSDMLKANGHHDVCEPRDYAVLYRTHRAAKSLQKAFAEAGVPYQIAGEGSPYEKPEIQAIIETMRFLLEPNEANKQVLTKLLALKRPSLLQLETLLAKLPVLSGLSVCDLASSIASIFSLPAEQNLQQFLSSLVQFGACDDGLEAALNHIDEISQSEFYDPTVNAVTLLTIHAAKGLEFANVFLIASEEGILPKLTKVAGVNLDEERRLFYVAVTRAQENLEILHTKFRAGERSKLSRFVTEIPDILLPRTIDPDMQTLERRADKRRQKRAQTSLF